MNYILKFTFDGNGSTLHEVTKMHENVMHQVSILHESKKIQKKNTKK